MSECDSLRRFVNTLQSLLVSHLAVCTLRLPSQENLAPPPSDPDHNEGQHRFPESPDGQDSTVLTSLLDVNKLVDGLTGGCSSLPLNCFMAGDGTEKPPDLPVSPTNDISRLVAAGCPRPEVTSTQVEAGVTWMGDHHDQPPAAILDEDTTLNSVDVAAALQMLDSKDFAFLAQELCSSNDCESRTFPELEQSIPETTPSVIPPSQPPTSVPQPIPRSQCDFPHLTPASTEMLDLPGYPWGTAKFQQRRQRCLSEMRGLTSGGSASFAPRHHHDDATKAGTTQVSRRLQHKSLRHVATSVSLTSPDSPGTRREVPSPAYPLPSVSPHEGLYQEWQSAEVNQVQSPDCHTHSPDCEMSEDDDYRFSSADSEWFNSLGNPPV